MSVSLDGLTTMYRAVLASKPWLRDPLCPRMPWSEAAYNLEDHGGDADVPLQIGRGITKPQRCTGGVPKLCFGIMWDDGRVRALPPVVRALKMVKDAVEAAGHQVMEWDAGDMHEMGRLLVRLSSNHFQSPEARVETRRQLTSQSGLASADGNVRLRYCPLPPSGLWPES